VVDALVAAGLHVELATHDARLADEALGRIARAGAACELQVLYGHDARAVVRIAARHRVPVRLYIPFGESRLPYAVDSLSRRPWGGARLALDQTPLRGRIARLRVERELRRAASS
jgi:hypothetical protein